MSPVRKYHTTAVDAPSSRHSRVGGSASIRYTAKGRVAASAAQRAIRPARRVRARQQSAQ